MRQFLNSASSKVILVVLFMSGCQGLKTRNDVNKHQPEARNDGRGSSPISTTPTLVTNAPESGDDGADALPKMQPSPPPAGPDTFLSKELPKIGVILGPGGLKTFAHIGVLREFARARVPIHAITGLEWGALMAGFYAEKGLANDVDWKAFRMKDSDLPSGGVLGGYRPRSMSDFGSYLQTVFPNSTMEGAKVSFACPTVVKRDRISFLAKGTMKEAISRCMPFPPMLGASGDYIAAADAVEESAAWLRSQGANLIVLVNVLGAGEPLSGRLAEDQYGTSVLWTEVRRKLLKVRAPTVSWIVSVNTAGKSVDDLGGRRANVELGAKAAADLTTKLTKQYGF